MGTPGAAPLVKPIAGILAVSPALIDEACNALAGALGPIDLESATERWSASDYYADEMGAEIWRRWVSLGELAPADRLPGWKQVTVRLEQSWTEAARRRVNLDPRYVDVYRLVLASTKDAAHRIYVGGGIFAEVTLRYEDGRLQAWRHTYPDYAASTAIDFFTRVRARYLAQRRAPRLPDPPAD